MEEKAKTSKLSKEEKTLMLTPEETIMIQKVSKLLSKKTAEQESNPKFRQGTVVHVPTRNRVENVSANFGNHFFLAKSSFLWNFLFDPE